MRVIFLYFLVSMPIAVLLYKRQNTANRLGGPISLSKALWLYWTVSIWFFVLPPLLYYWHWIPAIKYPLFFLTCSMWLRGVAELYMLFVSKNWIPPYGMGHDVFTFAGMLALFLWHADSLRAVSYGSLLFVITLMISLLVETYYAYAFYKLVQAKTKGQEGLWYAHAEDPLFQRILQLTRRWNWFFYLATLVFLLELAFN
jgi:hypothetical protein